MSTFRNWLLVLVLGICLVTQKKGSELCHNGSHFGTATRGGPVAVPKILTVLGSVGRLHSQAGWTWVGSLHGLVTNLAIANRPTLVLVLYTRLLWSGSPELWPTRAS